MRYVRLLMIEANPINKPLTHHMLSAQNNLQNTNNRANPSGAESGLVALLSAELWSYTTSTKVKRKGYNWKYNSFKPIVTKLKREVEHN